MTITKRIAFGAAASWFSRGVTILLGLVLLPVLFRNLPKEELGVWLLLGQSWAALGIFDLGFGVTLTRRIAFAKGKSGSDPNAPLTEETLVEIANLVATGKRVYRALAVFAFVMSFGAGFFYLRSLEISAVPLTHVWLAWGVLCLSQGFAVWATVWTCLLQGVGYIGWDAILATLISAFTLATQIVVVLLGGGLVSLAIIAACGALAQRFLILGFARRKRPELFGVHGGWQPTLVRGMAPLAFRAWLTALGGCLILYTDQFVIASFQGATELPAYRAAWILVHNLTVLAVTLGIASGVFVSHLWQAGDVKQVHRLLERNVRLGWLLMLAGAAVMIFAGEALFSLWLGPGNFVGYPVLLAFLLTETLEAQSYIISSTSRATEDEAFAFSSLAGGVVKLGLSILLAHRYGLLGVALGTVIALLLTNHWYVPLRGLKRLRYSRWLLVGRTVVPCLAWFSVLAGALFFVREMTVSTSSLIQLSSALAVTLPIFGTGFWMLVLEPGQRARVLKSFRSRIAPA